MKKLRIKKRKITHTLTPSQRNYRFQAGVSDRAKTQSRKQYRKSKGKEFELNGAIVLRALEHLDLDAEVLPVVNQLMSDVERLPVFRLQYVAKVLNVSYQTIWRWTTETQQLPMPVLVDNTKGREYPVYHLEEVKVMVRTIGEHLKEYRYYRKDNAMVKKQLFDQIEALRALNFNAEEPSNGNSQKGQSARKIRSKGGSRRAGSR